MDISLHACQGKKYGNDTIKNNQIYLDKQSIKAIASQMANSGSKRVGFDDDDTKEDSGLSDEGPLRKRARTPTRQTRTSSMEATVLDYGTLVVLWMMMMCQPGPAQLPPLRLYDVGVPLTSEHSPPLCPARLKLNQITMQTPLLSTRGWCWLSMTTNNLSVSTVTIWVLARLRITELFQLLLLITIQ